MNTTIGCICHRDRVNLGKLWLDTYLPEYDTIVWLDADTWVQDWGAPCNC